MLHTYSLGRATQYYPEGTALASDGRRSTFRELNGRVGRIAGALKKRGFKRGDRLAILLPNEPDYIELVYACTWLGLVAVPLNTRLSIPEMDHVLTDAAPHGLVRHSALAAPKVRPPLEVVLDQEPLHLDEGFGPDPIYDPDAILALIYTSGTTGRPKGVALTHANVVENIYHLSYWLPFWNGAVYLHAAPMFHIADFPMMFA